MKHIEPNLKRPTSGEMRRITSMTKRSLHKSVITHFSGYTSVIQGINAQSISQLKPKVNSRNANVRCVVRTKNSLSNTTTMVVWYWSSALAGFFRNEHHLSFSARRSNNTMRWSAYTATCWWVWALPGVGPVSYLSGWSISLTVLAHIRIPLIVISQFNLTTWIGFSNEQPPN